MKITPVPHDLDLLKSDIVRSPGIHMSEIYGDYYQDAEPNRYIRGGTPPAERMGLGFALEQALERGLRERMFVRPEEFTTVEGIAFSPDLLGFNGHTTLGELKLTWLSSREVPRVSGLTSFPPKFDKWITQIKVYGHHLEIPKARLYAFFVNGDYKKMSPELLCWDLEFTAREMREEWEVMLAHAKFKGML